MSFGGRGGGGTWGSGGGRGGRGGGRGGRGGGITPMAMAYASTTDSGLSDSWGLKRKSESSLSEPMELSRSRSRSRSPDRGSMEREKSYGGDRTDRSGGDRYGGGRDSDRDRSRDERSSPRARYVMIVVRVIRLPAGRTRYARYSVVGLSRVGGNRGGCRKAELRRCPHSVARAKRNPGLKYPLCFLESE